MKKITKDKKWETLIDFTKIKKGGVSAEEVLASLDRLKKHTQNR